MQVSIVVPTYNEKNTISRLINGVKESLSSSKIETNFLIVDDNSPDGTANVVQEMAKEDHNIHLISRPGKMGLGSAYIDAFRWMLTNANNHVTDVVIQMDADLSHPPQLISNMLKALVNKEVDVAIASRYCSEGSTTNWPLHRRITSRSANLFAKIALGVKVKDLTSGYKAFKFNVLYDLLSWELSSKGYEYQVESIYLLSKLGKKIQEVPFVFANRTQGKSKLSLKDIMTFMKVVATLRLKNHRKIENLHLEQEQQQPQKISIHS